MIIRKTQSLKKISGKKIGYLHKMSAVRVRVTWWFLFIPVFSKDSLVDIKVS